MMQRNNYNIKALIVLAGTAIIMTGISFMPGYTFGNITIKQANIFPEFIKSTSNNNTESLDYISNEYIDTSFYSEIPNDIKDEISQPTPHAIDADENINYMLSYVPIEDFSVVEDSTINIFLQKLINESKNRTIRIAVFGDSFIEADIFTSDLREQLQNQYGGCGVGYVPFSHPLTKYRKTISSTSIGWLDYSLMKRKEIPEELKPYLFVSGNLSVPENGAAKSYWKSKDYKKHLDHADKAQIVFINQDTCVMDITIDDSIKEQHILDISDSVQCITIDKDIHSLDIQLSNAKRFIGYGVYFTGRNGISVDNYSVRGNSGLTLLSTSRSINSQIESFINHDLIILQYGLNIVSDNVLDYSSYGLQFRKLIKYMRLCFPNSAIMVMSVSDRAKLVNGKPETMPGIISMVNEQRAAALETGACFWNTFEAMGGKNSIVTFVDKGWGGKDFTHINYNGGKELATLLYASINNSVNKIQRDDKTSDVDIQNIKVIENIATSTYKDYLNLINESANSHFGHKYWHSHRQHR